MQTPIDLVLDGMGFDESGQWHEGPFTDYWRWAFSDLGDEALKKVAAEMISKMWLGAGLAAMTPQELQILYMSTPLATNTSPAESGWLYDA
ncbi:MAG TPA: hypothetical protein VHX37_05440 [Acidobacteriaceae bacterium]|nr:hypothetical protein [Acidobacteriaceae bacterium]